MGRRIPAEVFPPGEFIRDELEARDWTQSDLAEILGRPFRLVNEIIAAKRAITPETAEGLGEAFGTTAQFWMNLETSYRLSLVEKIGPDVALRARLYEKTPIKEMTRRGWIDSTDDVGKLEIQVLNFLEIASLELEPEITAAARKSTSYSRWTPQQTAWLCRAKQLARMLDVAPFDRAKFESALPKLRKFIADDSLISHVPGFLAELGVRLVVVEPLSKTRVDGAVLWLDDASPVVALSLRFDRIDGCWHTLAHELGHIKHGDGMRLDDDLLSEESDDDKAERPDIERRADEFAGELLLPQQELNSFISRTRPYYSKTRINQFANLVKVHPGIIVGQHQRRQEIKYSQNREMLVKIRDRLLEFVLSDGWGSAPISP